MRLTHTLDILGRKITVSSNTPGVADTIARSWGRFAVASDADSSADVVMNVVQEEGDSRIRAWQFFNNGNLLVIADDKRLVTGYFVRKPWTIDVHVFHGDDQFTYYYLFEPLLLMLLARLGLVHWHSAAVATHDDAVLIAGVSGSGKSTTTLRLLTSGFTFVADDEVFLEATTSGVRVHGIDADVYATDDTLAMFPELLPLTQTPLVLRGHGYKRRVPAREMFVSPMSTPAVRAVLFPTVVSGQPTTFRPLSSSAAMMRFLAHQPKELPTYVTDRAAIDRRLETYGALARTARCFEVTLGADAQRLPALLAELMD